MLLLRHALALLDLFFLLSFCLPTTSQALAVVRLIPLTERVGVDLHNSGLGQGVRADEFVVRRMEDDADDTDFAGDALAAPGEIAGVEAEGAELAVAAPGTHEMDALGADTGVGGLTALLEGPVFTSESDGRREQSVYAYLFLR